MKFFIIFCLLFLFSFFLNAEDEINTIAFFHASESIISEDFSWFSNTFREILSVELKKLKKIYSVVPEVKKEATQIFLSNEEKARYFELDFYVIIKFIEQPNQINITVSLFNWLNENQMVSELTISKVIFLEENYPEVFLKIIENVRAIANSIKEKIPDKKVVLAPLINPVNPVIKEISNIKISLPEHEIFGLSGGLYVMNFFTNRQRSIDLIHFLPFQIRAAFFPLKKFEIGVIYSQFGNGNFSLNLYDTKEKWQRNYMLDLYLYYGIFAGIRFSLDKVTYSLGTEVINHYYYDNAEVFQYILTQSFYLLPGFNIYGNFQFFFNSFFGVSLFIKIVWFHRLLLSSDKKSFYFNMFYFDYPYLQIGPACLVLRF